MSTLPIGLNFGQLGQLAGNAALGLLPSVLFRQRLLGLFVPDVTIEEHSVDELEVTNHPVEQGAAITDHAFKLPSRITMRCGWTNSYGGANPIRVQTIYQGLLALQATRLPFIVISGKRTYKNMLFTSLSVTTDEKSENSLSLVAEMQEILIVSTQVLNVPNADVMKMPEQTAPTLNTGVRSLVPTAGNVTGGFVIKLASEITP